MTLEYTGIGVVRGFTIEAAKVEQVECSCECGYKGVAAIGESVAFCPDCGRVLWHRVCHDCKGPQTPAHANKPCQYCGCPVVLWEPANVDDCQKGAL